MYYAETHFIVGTAETGNTTFNQPIAEELVPTTVTQTVRVIQTDDLFNTYHELIKSKTSLNKIINELELNIDANNLSNLISFSSVADSNLLCLTVAYKDENKALQIANKLIDEFINNMSKAYSIDQVSVIDEAYILSDSDIASSKSVSQIATSKSIAKNAINHTFKNAVITAMVGFMLSVGISLLLEMFDDTIKNEDNLKKLINVNTLSTIDKNKTDNQYQFTILKIKLEKIKSFLVTSTTSNDDTSYISNNLANLLAKSKEKILLLDLTSNESDMVKKYNGKGLLDYINSENKDINKFISHSTFNNLDILLAGSNNSTYLEESQLKEVLSSLEKTYDKIIINSKNILEDANTLVILKTVNSTILATTQRKTKIDEFNKAKALIEDIDGNIVSNVLII